MSSASNAPATDDSQFDPVFLNARREAIVIFCVWIVCLLWAVPYCYINGYPAAGEEFNPDALKTVWGIPSWVFWGILFPWILANVFTTGFCFFYMVDDDLGEAHEDADLREEIAERHAVEEAGE